MGRLKSAGTHKGASNVDMNKRRKKSTARRVSATGSSSSSSSSSTSSTLSVTTALTTPSLAAATAMTSPTHSTTTTTSLSVKSECDQCGNPMAVESGSTTKTIANNSKKTIATGCQVCAFVVYSKSQRPCVQCSKVNCDYFCEWCGKGYHGKCARQCDENITNPDGFCCSHCEVDPGDEEGTNADDANAACGACALPFQRPQDTNQENEAEPSETEERAGFKVNQSVLVENDEVLYNATITHVDHAMERIKIHFLRWSKSFDHWYAMDDERINESLACDCCNQWFHIGCLPLIKSSGRFKDTTYVCPGCLEDAKGFYAMRTVGGKGTKGVEAVRVRKMSVVDEELSTQSNGAVAKTAIVKRRNGKKLVVVDSDSDEDVEVWTRSNSIPLKTEPTKTKEVHETKKTKESNGKTSTAINTNKSLPAKPQSSALESREKKAINTSSSTGNKRKRSNSTHSSSDTKSKFSVKKPENKTITTSKSSKKRERSISLDDEATTDDHNSSPEHVVTVHPSSPSTMATSPAASEEAITPPLQSDKNHKPQSFHRRARSGHSVSSILNSPSSPFPVSSPPSLSVAHDVSRPHSAPLSGRSLESQLVKVQEDPLLLPVSSITSRTSAPPLPGKSSTTTTTTTDSLRRLSAFDILREVATQSMGDDLRDSGSRDANAATTGISAINSYVDLHFTVRKEMYLRICQLEEDRCLDPDTAQLLRSMIYPTSDRFHDLQFVYVVNKDLPSWQLTKRLLELVPVIAGGTAPVVVPRMPLFHSPLPRPSIAIGSSHTGSNVMASRSCTGSLSTSVPCLLNPPAKGDAEPAQEKTSPVSIPKIVNVTENSHLSSVVAPL